MNFHENPTNEMRDTADKVHCSLNKGPLIIERL
jgi:hypothetical protein